MEYKNDETRLNKLIEAMTAIASLDFSKKLEVSEHQDLLDVVSLGFNMLSEALEDTVVSKQELEESEKKYKALFSKANDVIFLIKDSKIIDFNEKALEVFGYTPAELSGRHIAKLIPEVQENGQASWELVKTITKEALAKGNCLHVFQNIKKDRTIFEAEIKVGWFELNGILYFQTIIRDVSERRKSEINLQKSVTKFKALFEFAPNAMLISRGRELLQINPAFEEMFGYVEADLIDLNLEKLTYPEDRQLHIAFERDLTDEHLQKFSLEKRYVKKDGTIFYGFANVSIIKGVAEESDYYIIQIVDVTKQKKAEEQAHNHLIEVEKINQELDQFAHIVSHDLKAPLRGITAIANFIEEDIKDGNYEEIQENLGLLKNRIARMGNLITGILDFSKATKVNDKKELLALNSVIQGVIEMLTPSDKVQIKILKKLPTIHISSVGIQQIFQNLLSNAIKYNDKEICEITIDYDLKEKMHLFTVGDNGPGIPVKFQEQIFDIFQTLQPKDRVESTGVGLSIVRKRIESSGGKVWVESELGKGAKFIFTLPQLNNN